MLSLSFSLLILLALAGAVFSADKYSREDFPPGFVFGAGTSAYQVEGAANEDGRGPSVWDTFTHGNMWGGRGTGDVAVDQYHKYKEDVQLMVRTGLEAYRFSISWTRIMPNGREPVNPKGLQYYNNLIDELVSNGIQPHVTLYHYDHPQSLEDEYGGWISRKIVKDFTAFAEVCFREFGDRVLHWTTLNEPNALALLGYDYGFLPPNRCSPLFGVFNCSKGNSSTEPYLVTHHALLAHASAARLYKTKYQGRQHGVIGLSVLVLGLIPSTNTSADKLAVQRVNDFFHGLSVNPLVYGDYPDTVKKRVGLRLPAFTEHESKLVKGSFDFLGVIHYGGNEVKDNPDSLQWEPTDYTADWGAMMLSSDNSSNFSDFQYPIEPWYMREVLDYFQQAYGNPPIYILENGQRIHRNSSLEDTARVEYMQAYIGSVLDAVRNGSNVKGYFVWSFLDVFELLEGWQSGYGLYYVDLDDPELKRSPKLSAHWYSNFLKGGAVGSGGVIGNVSPALWSTI